MEYYPVYYCNFAFNTKVVCSIQDKGAITIISGATGSGQKCKNIQDVPFKTGKLETASGATEGVKKLKYLMKDVSLAVAANRKLP